VIFPCVQPANIFISKFGVVKVGDLGCCKLLSYPDEQCMSDYGSPRYLGPEVWRDSLCSSKSDIWAIGCVGYELLSASHEPAFRPPELAYKVTHDSPTPLPSVYSDGLRHLIEQMLQKDPTYRPSTVQLLQMPCMARFTRAWVRIAPAMTPP
jgi:NIMA (never in mitosis gene a)-related kinase